MFFSHLPFFGGAAAALDGLFYLGKASDANNELTYTFAAQPFGQAQADRIIVVGVASRDTTNERANSMTIGGVSATRHVDNGGANIFPCALFSAVVPTGTTGTVAVTFSGNMLGCVIGLWSIYGVASNTPHDTAFATNGSVSLDIPSNGCAVAMAWVGADPTWTNLTKDFYELVDPGSGQTVASGASGNLSSQTGRTISTSGGDDYIAAASWGP